MQHTVYESEEESSSQSSNNCFRALSRILVCKLLESDSSARLSLMLLAALLEAVEERGCGTFVLSATCNLQRPRKDIRQTKTAVKQVPSKLFPARLISNWFPHLLCTIVSSSANIPFNRRCSTPMASLRRFAKYNLMLDVKHGDIPSRTRTQCNVGLIEITFCSGWSAEIRLISSTSVIADRSLQCSQRQGKSKSTKQ